MSNQLGNITPSTPILETSDVGVANGVAGLDSSGLIPISQLNPQVICCSFTRNNSNFLQNNGSVYETSAKLIYPGTSITGTHSTILCNAWNFGGASIDIRVIDLNNGNAVVAEVLGITTTSTINIADLGTLSNLPASQSNFAVQVRLNGGGMGDQARISSITMY